MGWRGLQTGFTLFLECDGFTFSGSLSVRKDSGFSLVPGCLGISPIVGVSLVSKKGPAGRCRHAILNRLISVWRKMHDSSSKFYTFLLWGFVLFYAIAFIDFLRVLWYSVYRVYRILLWELPVPSISPLPCAWFLRRKDIPIRVFFFLLVWFIKKEESMYHHQLFLT